MNRITLATEHLRSGGAVFLVDDAAEGSRGCVFAAAENISEGTVAFFARECRGIITAPTSEQRLHELGLLPMVDRAPGDAPQLSVSIEARSGVTTGISASDRAVTLKALASGSKRDLVTPGHIFPVIVKAGGSLVRTTLEEGAVDLVSLAGLSPVAAFVAPLSESGELLPETQFEPFASRHNLPLVRLSEIVCYRLAHERLVEQISAASLPTHMAGTFRAVCFRSLIDGAEHLALLKGITEEECRTVLNEPLLVRVQTEQLVGDLLGRGAFSLEKLNSHELTARALNALESAGRGVFVYIRHPRKGLLEAQVKALSEGRVYGTEMRQLREFGIGAQILKALGISRIRLLTNSPPQSVRGIGSFQLEVVERVRF